MSRCTVLGMGIVVVCVASGGALGQTGFVNWETGQVSPMTLTPSGTRLLVVNTADHRLEVFDVSADTPVWVRSIPVGLDPVSVRARTENEAWVVNHISDSVSVVDVSTGRTLRTIGVADGPADVVFAGVISRAFVSCAKANQIMVFDLANPGSAPVIVPIGADEPRSLAVSADGSQVYAAIFFSGNRSTILPPPVVSNPGGPYAGQNPPPNMINSFDPPIAPGLPAPPPVALIVKQESAGGAWVDDNIGDWSAFVNWTLGDRDIAVVNANNPAAPVTYLNGLMNINMAIAVRADGRVTTVGTDAMNEVRFEEKLNGIFVRAQLASADPVVGNAGNVVMDLNPHLDYSSSTTTAALREQSVGDPRAIVWTSLGSTGYVAGMGSSAVAAIDASGARLGQVDVGQGPTGLALRESRSRLYVLNRFEGSISEIDTVSLGEVSRVSFYDPTPDAIRLGRPLLYDTHLTSGLGQSSCGSCHVDARFDGLAWDLGAPTGEVKLVNQPCRQGPGNCAPWHPMKGPMVTQSLQGIVGAGAMHWRGDRENVAAFNPTYENLHGSSQRSAAEMQRLTDFIATIVYAPNPNRNIDHTLRTAVTVTNGTGNAQNGLTLFNTAPVFGGGLTCLACHPGPAATDGRIDSPGGPIVQSLKDVQLRGMEEKTGWNRAVPNSSRGFGFNHDGTVDTLATMFANPPFNFPGGGAGAQQRRDMEAFMLSLSSDTHAGVGRQVTLNGINNGDANVTALLNQFIAIANTNQAALVVKGVQGGIARGYMYTGGGNYQSDRLSEVVSDAALRSAASAGNELTWTLVPGGTQRRIGIDRDSDGLFDRDELDAGSDPADPFSTPPAPVCEGDATGDRVVDFADLTSVLAHWGENGPEGDADHNEAVNFADVTRVLSLFGNSCL